MWWLMARVCRPSPWLMAMRSGAAPYPAVAAGRIPAVMGNRSGFGAVPTALHRQTGRHHVERAGGSGWTGERTVRQQLVCGDYMLSQSMTGSRDHPQVETRCHLAASGTEQWVLTHDGQAGLCCCCTRFSAVNSRRARVEFLSIWPADRCCTKSSIVYPDRPASRRWVRTVWSMSVAMETDGSAVGGAAGKVPTNSG